MYYISLIPSNYPIISQINSLGNNDYWAYFKLVPIKHNTKVFKKMLTM